MTGKEQIPWSDSIKISGLHIQNNETDELIATGILDGPITVHFLGARSVSPPLLDKYLGKGCTAPTLRVSLAQCKRRSIA
jgi:hypothetical protein